MSEVCKNVQPISFEEFIERVRKNVHQLKNYYSLYITSKGEILDCGYPSAFGHNKFCIDVYTHLEELDKSVFKSNLQGLGLSFEDIAYYLMDYFNLLDVMYVNPELYTNIEKILLGSEDIICQDMGFVKVAINTGLRTCEVVPPNVIFGKAVTAAQKEVIQQLSTYFNLNMDVRLKNEQKENIELAVEINSALNSLRKQ